MPPKGRTLTRPSGSRLHGQPQCSSWITSPGASFTKASTTSWSARKSLPKIVSFACVSRLSLSRMTAAVPPSADTVWLRMGYTFERTAIESRGDSSAAAMAARSPAPPPPITRRSCWYASSPGIFGHSLHVEVAAVAVVNHDNREVLNLEASDGFGAEVLVGDDLELLHVLGEHRARAADSAEVDALVLPERVLHGLPAMALADGRLEPELQQGGRELVHPAAGGGSDRADDVARPCRRWPRVVDDLSPHVDRQRLTRFDEGPEPPVRGVARRVQHARDPHPVAGLQLLDVRVAERRCDLLDSVSSGRHAHRVTSLCRCAWHSMVTATGSEVMWQGYVRMWMPNAVVSPPYPCGPIPRRLARSRSSFSRASRAGSGFEDPSSRKRAFLERIADFSKVPPTPTPRMSGG